MEKRVVIFMVLAAAIMVAYVALQATFGPKPQPQQVAKKGDIVNKKLPDKKKPDGAPDKKKAELEKPDPEKPDPEKPVDPESPEKPPIKPTTAKEERTTLGSIDPASPYRMLVTFNSRGAAIERVEMASERYRDLEDRSGYLGHLALSDVKGGARVNVVGAGTPAASAVDSKDAKIIGLQPGDIIDGFNGLPIKTREEFEASLATTKPKDEITLNVTRGGTKHVFAVALMRRPLEVIRPEIQPATATSPAIVHPLSCLMTLTGPRAPIEAGANVAADPLKSQPWAMKLTTSGKNQVVEFTMRLDESQAKELGLGGAVEVVRRYTLASVAPEEQDNPAAKGYHVDCELTIRNLGDKSLDVAYQFDGPNGLPLEGWWYTNKIGPGWSGYGARDVVVKPVGGVHAIQSTTTINKYVRKNPKKPVLSLLGTEETTPIQYVGVDAQYFCALWFPDVSEDQKDAVVRTALALPATGNLDGLAKGESKKTNTTFRVTSNAKVIPAGEVYQQTMRLFAGPKVPALLDNYEAGDVMYYGWFRVVSIPLAHLLHFLKHNIFFNYGLAIIAMTFLVRACMVPFSLKAAKNAKMMQDLQPEMKAIAEKYKNDMQKRSEAQSALFKKHNYNPLSGCAPMFMQLPIFLGLYRALSTDIELRQAALIPGLEWASNLAGPDQLFYWGQSFLPDFIAGELGWLGPYFNFLPLISVAFLMVHQKLFTPPATDEQTKMTQDMMKYMTVFMGVMFFKVPAGLCLYFITSSLWSICERLWLPKAKPAAAGGTIVEKEVPPPKPSTNGAEEKSRPKKPKQGKK